MIKRLHLCPVLVDTFSICLIGPRKIMKTSITSTNSMTRYLLNYKQRCKFLRHNVLCKKNTMKPSCNIYFLLFFLNILKCWIFFLQLWMVAHKISLFQAQKHWYNWLLINSCSWYENLVILSYNYFTEY
jgi:hypothetical protein